MIDTVFRGARRAVIAACALFTVPAASATITVTPATFNAAIAAARAGDTLNLVGTFGNISIANRHYASRLTIGAAYATFTGTVTLNNDSNIYFGGGTFNIAGAPDYTKAVVVYGGRNIAFNAPTMTGSAGGEGIVFSGTTGASVANGTFTGLQVAVVLGSVTTGTVSKNTVIGAVSDGIDIADSHGVTASYNSCSGGQPGMGVHPDCIQLWSVTGKPLQSNIVVRNNIATGPTQGFTAFDSMGGEERIQIINNIVNTSFSQGVACYSCVYSNISYNTLTTMPGSTYKTNLNVIGGRGNTVIGNVVTPYSGLRTDGLEVMALAAESPLDWADDTPDLAALVGVAPPSGPSVVPEPSTWAMLIAGFAAIGGVRRRAGGVARRRGGSAAIA